MRKRNFSKAVIALLWLSGCTQPSTLVKSEVMIWPDLPDVPVIQNPDLKPLSFEVPTAKSFIALDQKNWQNFQYNWQAIKSLNEIYQDRINQVNLQRKQWRDLNEKNNATNNSPK